MKNASIAKKFHLLLRCCVVECENYTNVRLYLLNYIVQESWLLWKLQWESDLSIKGKYNSSSWAIKRFSFEQIFGNLLFTNSTEFILLKFIPQIIIFVEVYLIVFIYQRVGYGSPNYYRNGEQKDEDL